MIPFLVGCFASGGIGVLVMVQINSDHPPDPPIPVASPEYIEPAKTVVKGVRAAIAKAEGWTE